MRQILKKAFISIFVTISKIIIPLFYKKKYLCGKWFDKDIHGWIWAWRCIWSQKILDIINNRRFYKKYYFEFEEYTIEKRKEKLKEIIKEIYI